MKNAIATIRSNHSATLNNAARQELNRRSSLRRECRNNAKSEQLSIVSVGETFTPANLSSNQQDLITFYLEWLSEYAHLGKNTLMSNKGHEFDPVKSQLRYARAYENCKNRDNLHDVVDTAFLVFLESVQYGADENGQLLRKVDIHQNNVFDRTPVLCEDDKIRRIVSIGGTITKFSVYEDVDKLFTGCLRWAVGHCLANNSASVDTRSDATMGYRQARGVGELNEAMDATGLLNDEHKAVRDDLATGWNVKEIAIKRKMSQKQVRNRIATLKTAATIASKK